MGCSTYTIIFPKKQPTVNIHPQKLTWHLKKGHSCWKPSFFGSMLVFTGTMWSFSFECPKPSKRFFKTPRLWSFLAFQTSGCTAVRCFLPPPPRHKNSVEIWKGSTRARVWPKWRVSHFKLVNMQILLGDSLGPSASYFSKPKPVQFRIQRRGIKGVSPLSPLWWDIPVSILAAINAWGKPMLHLTSLKPLNEKSPVGGHP